MAHKHPLVGKQFNPYKKFYNLQIPDCVARSGLLNPSAKLLLGKLFQYGGKNGKAFPTRETLAKDLNLTVRSIDRAIAMLKEQKFIDTYQETATSPSHYVFLYHEIYIGEGRDEVLNQVEKRVYCTDKNDSTCTDKSGNHNKVNIKKNVTNVTCSRNRLDDKTSIQYKRRLFKTQKPVIDTKRRIIDPLAIRLLNYWNKHSSLTTHKINVAEDGNVYAAEQTKTVANFADDLLKIMAGNFYTKFKLRPALQKRKWSIDSIKKAIKRLDVAFGPDYYSGKNKPSIGNFFWHAKANVDENTAEITQLRYKYSFLYYAQYEPTPLSQQQTKKNTEFPVLIDKLIDKLTDAHVIKRETTKYNQVTKQFEKAVSVVRSVANGNSQNYIRRLPVLLPEILQMCGKKRMSSELPLAVYKLESVMNERLMH